MRIEIQLPKRDCVGITVRHHNDQLQLKLGQDSQLMDEAGFGSVQLESATPVPD